MLRVCGAPLRSVSHVLSSKSQCPIHPDLFQYLAAPLHSKSWQEDPHDVVSLIPTTSLPKLLVVQPRLRPDTVLQAKLDEALNLVYSLEDHRRNSSHKDLPPYVLVQNPALSSPRPRADTFFGPGTVDTIKCHLNAVESEEEVDAIFVNTILSGVQQRNLERIWDRPVLDRVGLIIEIFNAHAQTKEAKLQAELAALVYKKSRLVRVKGSDGRYTFGTAGEAEVVSARGRGSGGRGFISGAGETELQLQRRRILERRSHLLTQVEEVRRTRAVQRAARKKHGGSHGQGLPTIAVVGYTNAGKSTLVSALSQTHLYSDDRLFATVDPRLRSALLPSGRKVLLSDTVGFISELPVQLVEAFHATLEEVGEADLLVHVLDSCAPNLNEQRSTVLEVLEQIGVSKEKIENMIEVGNKIDLLEKSECANESLEDGESNSLSEEEDGEAVDLWPPADDQAHFSEVENDDDLSSEELVGEPIGNNGNGKVCDQSLQDMRKTTDDQERDDDYSDDHNSAKEQVNGYSDSTGLKTPEHQESEPSGSWAIAKQSSSETQYTPHVKTSATRRVGLQELLELVDEKLKTQDEKLMPRKIGGSDIYSKKWRPPHTNDAEIAVEQ